MSIDFKPHDFAHPISIVNLKRQFDRNQWAPDLLRTYQTARLKKIIAHAAKNVPYYRELFAKTGLKPEDIRKPEDIIHIPFLTKEIIRQQGNRLLSEKVKVAKVTEVTTSGSSGSHIKLWMDKPANVLEFVYYWRLWAWFGYRLGSVFAEISAQHFAKENSRSGLLIDFKRLAGRLLVNNSGISKENINEICRIFQKYRPRFLKGLASNLYVLASLMLESGHKYEMKAVFSSGENLLDYQRRKIEEAFECKVADCYGHMERVAAISQCPFGTYHVHEDYGFCEFVEPENAGFYDSNVREIVGTSMHNFAMPFIRYRTGDLVVPDRNNEPCPCGRVFRTVRKIIGRDADIIVTQGGRKLTALYTAFDNTPGLVSAKIIQTSLTEIEVWAAFAEQGSKAIADTVRYQLELLTGNSMSIRVIEKMPDEIRGDSTAKFKIVSSLLTGISG